MRTRLLAAATLTLVLPGPALPFSRDERYRRQEAPGVWVNFHLDGTFRQATASGTVSDGTTNFTPEPALTGYGTRLGSIKVGEVDIIRQ